MSNFDGDPESPSRQVVVGNAPQPLDATLLQMELEYAEDKAGLTQQMR